MSIKGDNLGRNYQNVKVKVKDQPETTQSFYNLAGSKNTESTQSDLVYQKAKQQSKQI
jgi:hypothetical protein